MPHENERLVPGFVPPTQKEFLDRLVNRFRNVSVINGDIYVGTSYVMLVRVRQQKLRNPATNDHQVVLILTQEVRELDQDGASGCNGVAP